MRASSRVRQCTLLVVGDQSKFVRKLNVPYRRLEQLAIAAGVLALIGVAGAGHYVSLLGTRFENRTLRDENAKLRTQMQVVEERVAHIAATLDRVEQFDAKLRGTVKQLQLPEPGVGIGPVGKGDDERTAAPGPGADDRARGRQQEPSPAKSNRASQAQPVPIPAAEAPSAGVLPRLASLESVATRQESSLRVLDDYFRQQQSLLASTPATWPTRGWVTSDFGERLDPITAELMMHRGLDIATPTGQPIYAPSDGTVTFAGNESGYGKVLVLDHGHGVNTRYGHLSAIYVRSGQRVKRGARLAAVGNTGRSTGPHLHYEVRVNGLAENPRKFLLQ